MPTPPPSLASATDSASGLIYVDDQLPGITREQTGKGWLYRDPGGRIIRQQAEIDRLNRVGLPPAYGDAWFCPAPNGHILATGYDARGRKQYRYHPDFRAHRESRKFDGLPEFARMLPLIRKRVEDDLAARGLGRERAIASVVRLLDSGGIRVGNDHYAKANRSFGATTLRMRHAEVRGQTLRLSFRGKSGQMHEMRVTDRALARFVRAMQDLPGQRLFQYVGEDGACVPVGSDEVNAYLRETMAADFTAKHFRTWTASARAFALLAESTAPVPPATLANDVAATLGNTPAVARKSYIHPALMGIAGDNAAHRSFRAEIVLPRATRWLSRHERGLILWLEQAAPRAADLLAA